ncbi:MAG: site-specific integrase [Gammaproteobacteria bacterium]|nr:site-specific integrase [Gammaproteobacteria bacterium]
MLATKKTKVRIATFSNGERYPFLIDDQGIPLWYPTLFTTVRFRNVSMASNTILSVLSSIRVLMAWAQLNDVDLEARFLNKRFLSQQEVESLCTYLQTKSSDLELQKNNVVRVTRRLEGSRATLLAANPRVSHPTQYIRTSYVANYLEWLAIHLIERQFEQVDRDAKLLIDRMVEGIRMRRPLKSRSSVSTKKGLTKEQRAGLLELIDQLSDKNPFTVRLRRRNQIIVLLLYHLGLRGGELLALRISDFDFQRHELLVARRPDNPNDPRPNQPVVKTVDRRLALSTSLSDLVADYIMQDRNKIKGAKKHDFLLITHQAGPFEGQPLSIKGLAKVFTAIGSAMSNQIDSLTPHLLRHTANDLFSELMDQKNTQGSEEYRMATEEKIRSYLMGWKEGSGTAATYTKRFTENKAMEVSLEMQNKMWKGINV